MQKNVGKMDKNIRIVLGIILFAIGAWQIPSTLGIVLAIIGIVLILTGAFSFCGLYKLLGINTRKANNMPEAKKPEQAGQPGQDQQQM